MQEQDIKRGNFKVVEGDNLGNLLTEIFGSFEKDGDVHLVNYGALKPFKVWIKDKSTMCIETIMNTDVDEETAIDTRKRYNDFLNRATGFTSKQRRDRLKKKAKEGKL